MFISVALAKQEDNALCNVYLSAHPFVCVFVCAHLFGAKKDITSIRNLSVCL